MSTSVKQVNINLIPGQCTSGHAVALAEPLDRQPSVPARSVAGESPEVSPAVLREEAVDSGRQNKCPLHAVLLSVLFLSHGTGVRNEFFLTILAPCVEDAHNLVVRARLEAQFLTHALISQRAPFLEGDKPW